MRATWASITSFFVLYFPFFCFSFSVYFVSVFLGFNLESSTLKGSTLADSTLKNNPLKAQPLKAQPFKNLTFLLTRPWLFSFVAFTNGSYSKKIKVSHWYLVSQRL